MARSMRIVAIGGDASLWVGLSSELGGRASQMFLPKTVDAATLGTTAVDADVLIVVIAPLDEDPTAILRTIKDLGLHRNTIVIADAQDSQAVADSVSLGMAGFVAAGASPDHVAGVISHVVGKGVMLDGPAAELLHGRNEILDQFGPESQISAARALASALALKDTYTGGHAERVAALAMRLAEVALLEGALPGETLETAFLLHDVGKIGIPESILTKPGGLTHTERRVLQTHPILGERIISPLGFPQVIHQVVRHHHEWWDGSGYPDGLSGAQIPAAARLFSIADAIDAMTSVRPYRRPVSFEHAVNEIVLCSGTQFDPDLADLAEKTFLEGPIHLIDASGH